MFETPILVTGAEGFLGRSVILRLARAGLGQLDLISISHRDCDLTREAEVSRMYYHYSPKTVIHLAAVCGGIGANQAEPGRFFRDNMAMGINVIEHARLHAVRKFITVGTVCSYPADCPIPFVESDLFNGMPEPTNSAYGIAKRALIKMLAAYWEQYEFRSTVLIPTNMYGPYDHFEPKTSHVIPAMIRRFYESNNGGKDGTVVLWGTGTPTRDFVYVADVADAIAKAAESDETWTAPINIGSGVETRIDELAFLIAHKLGYQGYILWDSEKPDGQRRRCLSIERVAQTLGWKPTTSLSDGLDQTIDWYQGLIYSENST